MNKSNFQAILLCLIMISCGPTKIEKKPLKKKYNACWEVRQNLAGYNFREVTEIWGNPSNMSQGHFNPAKMHEPRINVSWNRSSVYVEGDTIVSIWITAIKTENGFKPDSNSSVGDCKCYPNHFR